MFPIEDLIEELKEVETAIHNEYKGELSGSALYIDKINKALINYFKRKSINEIRNG